MHRRVAALFTLALLSCAIPAHFAFASTDAAATSPISAVQEFIAGLVTDAEAIIASAEAGISDVVAAIASLELPGDSISYSAAAAASQASPAVSPAQPPLADPFGPPPQPATPAAATQVVIEKEPIIEQMPSSGSTISPSDLHGIFTGLSDVLSLIPSAVSSGNSSPDVESQIAALQSAISNQSYSAAASPPLGGGAPNTIAAANAIDNLSGVTITDANLTASEIPDLSGSYLSVNGGTLTGVLNSSSTATSTFAGGISVTAGCFSVNGTCVGGSGGGGSGTVGSGTQGQFAFYDAAGTTLSATSSLFISPSGTIGIGTTSPQAALDVYGSGNNPLLYTGPQASSFDSLSQGYLSGVGANTFAVLNPSTGQNFTAINQTNSPTADSGYINGILSEVEQTANTGTSTQIAAVEGDAYNTGNGNASLLASYYGFVKQEGTGNVGVLAGAYLEQNIIGAGTVTTNTGLYVGNQSGGLNNYEIYANSTSPFVVEGSGNVGIGTTNPSYMLDVNGAINIAGNAAGYQQAGNTILYASTTNASLAVGASAAAAWMSASSTLWDDVAIGQGALATTPTNATAQYNTAVGFNSLTSNTTGSQNTANGLQALYSNTTGNYNTANGLNSLYFNTTGSSNTANGIDSLASATSTTGDTAVGFQSGYNISGATGAVGNFNTLFGYQSGYSITTGGNNVLLGQSTIAASYNQVTTGSNNISIGNDVAVPSQTASDQLDIGNLIYGTGLTSTGLNAPAGNIGIGTTSPSYKLTVDNAGSSGIVAGFENSSGECTINPTSSSINCSSDITLKKNINSMSDATALASVLSLNPVFFNWNAEATGTPQHSGFIAQQMQPIFPDLISQADNGTLLLNYAGLTPYLTAAVQAQQAELNALVATTSTTTVESQSFAASFFSNLFSQITAWLASAGNGIGEFFAQVGNFGKVNSKVDTTQELCVSDAANDPAPVCLTKTQLAAVLASASQSTSAPASPSPSTSEATDTPPIIQINGDNPAVIQVGASYTDLGATITGPQADLNLGIQTYLNGILENPIELDTSAAATDTIAYVVTDSQGLTSTSTRTVIVEPAAAPPASPPAATSSSATTTVQ